MINRHIRALAASSILLAGASAPGWAQETVQGGSSGAATGRDVSASTYGSGETTSSDDGSSIGVSGGGDASALDGGTATTDASAKVNDRRAMQRSTATATDDDENARSRTRTMVREGKDVRSRTVTRYKEDGAPPERTSTYTVTNPDGTTTTRTK